VRTSWTIILPETIAMQTKLTVLVTSTYNLTRMFTTVCDPMFRFDYSKYNAY